MKKYSWLVLMGLLMVGCGNQEISKEVTDINNTRIDRTMYYEENTAIALACKEFKEAADEYDPNREENVSVDYQDEDEYTIYPSINMYYSAMDLDKESSELLDNKMTNRLDKNLTPGIKDFIKKVCEEKEDLSPQSTVINNHFIIMYPTHLYTNDEYPAGPNIMIGLNNFEIKGDLFKKLISAVDTSKFVVERPLIGEKGAVLQISTPFYINESYVGKEGKTYREFRKGTYGKPNVSFRLYIKDGELNEIHTIVKQDEENSISKEELAPVSSWLKSEWQIDGTHIDEVEQFMDSMLSNTLNKQKGTFGECTYTYDIQSRSYDKGKIMELVLKKAS